MTDRFSVKKIVIDQRKYEHSHIYAIWDNEEDTYYKPGESIRGYLDKKLAENQVQELNKSPEIENILFDMELGKPDVMIHGNMLNSLANSGPTPGTWDTAKFKEIFLKSHCKLVTEMHNGYYCVWFVTDEQYKRGRGL